MALGMTPTQAYGGTRIQETNQSKNGQCTGTIIDPTGEPVIGATVTVKGKQGGTITDLDGKFVLSDVQHGATVCISYSKRLCVYTLPFIVKVLTFAP